MPMERVKAGIPISLLPRRPELLVCLVPIDPRKGFLDGVEEVFSVQRLKRHVMPGAA